MKQREAVYNFNRIRIYLSKYFSASDQHTLYWRLGICAQKEAVWGACT